MIRIASKPTDIVIVQVYFLTSGHGDDKVEEIYEKIEQ